MSEAARAAMQQADELISRREFTAALGPAREACLLSPESSEAWWNLAIAAKHAHAWADCLRACERSISLTPDASEGACWNAGIAATALRQWPRAREAWAGCGIQLPDGDGPLQMTIGHAWVRVNPQTEPEVVFCKRIDPCRAQILSVPLPDSGRRFGDLVLHDGERRGTRRHQQAEYAVFDELTLYEPSDYGTWQVSVVCRDSTRRDHLLDKFEGVDGAVEDWTENVSLICARCSLGEPPEDHDHDHAPTAGWQPARRLGLALRHERDLKRLRRFALGWLPEVHEVTRVL